MLRFGTSLAPWMALASLVVAPACTSVPELLTDADGAPDSAADEDGDDGQDGDSADGTSDDLSIDDGDGSADEDDGDGNPTDPCATLDCGLGQRCEVQDGAGSCVDNICEDLECTSTELCSPAPGGGYYCDDISCDADVECPANQHCDAGLCTADVCSPGTLSCTGNDVMSCTSNGGGEELLYACAGGDYFESSCGEQASGTGCSCQDEWDCPLDTTCDAGRCVGTGKAPTCALDPVPFDTVLPDLEFHWGGTNVASPSAPAATPFPSSAHVSSTPLVANLDDDNGDGLVNERDFPEIVFVSYRSGDDVRRNGVVRAIHATGEPRGQDYFAVCGGVSWHEGDPLLGDADCTFGTSGEQNDRAYAMPGGTPAVGDIDGDGFPEIVVPTTRRSLLVLNNRGDVIVESAPLSWPGNLAASQSQWNFSSVALVNLDHQGLAEAIVGNRVFTFRLVDDGNGGTTLAFDRKFTGGQKTGQHTTAGEFGPVVCAADINDDYAGLELVAGSTAYHLPEPPAGEDPCSLPENATHNYCLGVLDVVWNFQTLYGTNEASGGLINAHADGFCAVADVLGTDPSVAPGPVSPLDGSPEVILVANGWLVILDGQTGVRRRLIDLQGGTVGGAPNVDDFDGDGFPEIATALSDFYRVVDLQDVSASCPAWGTVLGKTEASPGGNQARAPGGAAEGACTTSADCNEGAVCGAAGSCVCLHNGWFRSTEDNSSKATSSSVFDFNGDGAAEVAYNDECYFRMFDGATGQIHLAIPSLSRTVIENPAIADVDNDGNAEIITVSNTDVLQCDETDLAYYPVPTEPPLTIPKANLANGIEVWGEASDAWVSARRVWNQQAYHVTNVTEAGSLPLHEPENFLPYGGRLYNTYRSQPRVYGAAPDLTLGAIEISSPDVACGELSDVIDVVVEVKNQGDLRVGPGVSLAFYGTFASPVGEVELTDDLGAPLVVVLTESLEPGASTLISVRFDKDDGPTGELPSEVRASIDSESAERECIESNNDIEAAVDPGESLADLRLEFVGSSNCVQTRVRVTNEGSAPASGVEVTIYAGDPAQGGRALTTISVASSLAAGASVERNIGFSALSRTVTLFGIVDPADTIPECNSQNNLAEGPRLSCGGGVN